MTYNSDWQLILSNNFLFFKKNSFPCNQLVSNSVNNFTQDTTNETVDEMHIPFEDEDNEEDDVDDDDPRSTTIQVLTDDSESAVLERKVSAILS